MKLGYSPDTRNTTGIFVSDIRNIARYSFLSHKHWFSFCFQPSLNPRFPKLHQVSPFRIPSSHTWRPEAQRPWHGAPSSATARRSRATGVPPVAVLHPAGPKPCRPHRCWPGAPGGLGPAAARPPGTPQGGCRYRLAARPSNIL